MGWGARFAGVVVAGAMLSGCGGAGPEGQALPTAEASAGTDTSSQPSASAEPVASPSASPSAVRLEGLPSSAREHSSKGAVAFVRYWIETANRAFRTGAVDRWRELSSTSCKTCEARISDVEKAYGAGGHIEGGELTVVDLLPTPVRKGEIPFVVADLKVSIEKRYAADGTVADEFPGEPAKLVFYMEWRDSSWSVSQIKAGVE